MNVNELKPLDIIASHKRENGWWPPYKAFDHLLDEATRKYGRKIYPHGDNEYFHIRLVIGKFAGMMIGFEFTFSILKPAARFFPIEQWMLEPSYASVYRREWGYTDQFLLSGSFAECLKYDGGLYDLGELISMGIFGHLVSWLNFGGKNRVCSTGARKIIEEVTRVIPLFAEVKLESTPPASWANSPEWIKLN